MPENIPQWTKRPDLSDDDQRQVEFKLYITERGFSADQLRAAYYRALGDTASGGDDPSVEELSGKILEMTDSGFPINRFASLIGSKQKYEDAKISCFGFIDSLSVSDNEKWVLRSIVERRRSGSISVDIADRESVDFKVRIPDNTTTEAFALEFLEVLQGVVGSIPQGTRYGFNFTEE